MRLNYPPCVMELIKDSKQIAIDYSQRKINSKFMKAGYEEVVKKFWNELAQQLNLFEETNDSSPRPY